MLGLGHNDLAFFDSDLAVNYVTFGSEHQKLVGNPDRHPDATPLHRAAECPFCVSTVTFLQTSLKPLFRS